MSGQKKIVYPITFNFTVGNPVFFNNAEDKYELHKDVIDDIIKALDGEFTVGYLTRKKKFIHGINAQSLNEAIRKKLELIPGIQGETDVVFGSFLPTKKMKGEFDFCIYDQESNFYNLWNHCYGKTGAVNNGDDVVDYYIKQSKCEAEWDRFLDERKPQKYVEDLVIPSKAFNLIGEIQFGNWAMVYKDMFRLVSAINKKAKIDLYIYVAANGNLLKLMSDNIVVFKDVCKRFRENVENHNINKPVMILPLDVDFEVNEYNFSEAEDGLKSVSLEIEKCEKKINQYKTRLNLLRAEKKGLKGQLLEKKKKQINSANIKKKEFEQQLENLLNKYKEVEEKDD